MKEAKTWKKRITVSVMVISRSLQYDLSFTSEAEGGFCSGVQSLIQERNTILRGERKKRSFLFSVRVISSLGLF